MADVEVLSKRQKGVLAAWIYLTTNTAAFQSPTAEKLTTALAGLDIDSTKLGRLIDISLQDAVDGGPLSTARAVFQGSGISAAEPDGAAPEAGAGGDGGGDNNLWAPDGQHPTLTAIKKALDLA